MTYRTQKVLPEEDPIDTNNHGKDADDNAYIVYANSLVT